jgi:hypothetical protein
MTTVFTQLADEKCFILARLEPKADGGTDKIPTDPATGYNSNAQDPSTWITGAEAAFYASQWNVIKQAPVIEYGVGVMIADGRFCIDLDHCREGEGWQPHALAFINRFPGAAVEVSASMEGLHIFGTSREMPLHGTRCKTYRMEAYTKERFIYVSGLGAYGDIRTDQTENLKRFLADFFPAHDHGSADWSSGPNVEWRGPTDDNELLRRAFKSMSGKQLMKQAASFETLWRGDASELARFYPPQAVGKSFDASGADQALANQLAFWTGNDCERMARMMNTSGLKREKWQRADYFQGTIMRACADAREWYKEKAAEVISSAMIAAITETGAIVPPPPTDVLPDGVPAPPPHVQETNYSLDNLPNPGEYINVHWQQQIFSGMCYVRDIHKVQMPDGSAWAQKQFDVVLGHRKWAIEADNSCPSKSAWEAFTNSQIASFEKVQTQFFGPKFPTGTIREVDGHREINCYKPAIIQRTAGDATPFLQLMSTMVPDETDRRILLSWCASLVRNLGVKFKWAVFLQGCEGNGKSTLARILEYSVSQRYTHWAKPSEIGDKFNSPFVEKILLIIDEAKTAEYADLQEALKLMVTSTRSEVRPMYAEKMMKDVCFNIFLISNYKNAVKIEKGSRRYAPFYCAQQDVERRNADGLTEDYFVEFNKWLDAEGFAICYDYLMSYDIAAEYDPAGACVVAPATSSTEEAITASLGGIEQELMTAIEKKENGFKGGWIRDVEVDHLLARIGKDKAVPRNQRKALILALGYISHPALSDGLCPVAWPDGTTPRIYVAKGHPWAVDYLSPEQVRDGYLASQRDA